MRTKEESILWICKAIRSELNRGSHFAYIWSGDVKHNGKTWCIWSAAFANQGDRIGMPFFRLQNLNNRWDEQEFYLDELNEESLDNVVTCTKELYETKLHRSI